MAKTYESIIHLFTQVLSMRLKSYFPLTGHLHIMRRCNKTEKHMEKSKYTRNKMYSVKEVYYTIQGEGYHTGRPAVFLRFTGCNLWSGLEKDREKAICNFCDTDFVGTNGPGGGKFDSAKKLANHVLSFWPDYSKSKPFVVCTGGEPLLQIDKNFIDRFHHFGFEIAVETNGTIAAPSGIDWICVSPKANSRLILDICFWIGCSKWKYCGLPENYKHIIC